MAKATFSLLLVALLGLQGTETEDLGYAYSCWTIEAHPFCPEANSFVRGMTTAEITPIMETLKKGLASVSSSVSASCVTAINNLYCFMVPQCRTYKDPYYINATKYLDQCQKLDSICSITGLCDSLRDISSELLNFSNWTCLIANDPTGFCPDVNYKVARPGTNGTTAKDIVQLQNMLETSRLSINTTCYNWIKTLGCHLSRRPICSDDETYFVAPITEKDCLAKLQCLPISYDDSGEMLFPHSACTNFPDEFAKRVPIPSNVSGVFPTGEAPAFPQNKATSPKITGIIRFLIAILSGLFFS